MQKQNVVAVSGGFDPLHVGHIRLIKEARTLGDRLVVILNNDNWLINKKRFVFMNEAERKEILLSFPFVDEVIITSHTRGDADQSVSRELATIRPDIFANGGDRNAADAENPDSPLYRDLATCAEHGIEVVFGVGKGGKVQSSSWLTDAIRLQGIATERPWGSMTLYAHGKNFWLKTITVAPGARLSLQRHHHRGEFWMCIDGEVLATIDGVDTPLKPFGHVSFGKESIHRLSSTRGGTIIEVAYGTCDEADNERLEDDFGRV